MTKKLGCIILAAGKGVRMKSALPKPLHKLRKNRPPTASFPWARAAKQYRFRLRRNPDGWREYK